MSFHPDAPRKPYLKAKTTKTSFKQIDNYISEKLEKVGGGCQPYVGESSFTLFDTQTKGWRFIADVIQDESKGNRIFELLNMKKNTILSLHKHPHKDMLLKDGFMFQ